MNKQKYFIIIVPIILVIIALYFTRTRAEGTADLVVNPSQGPFRVTVTTTGELRALKNTPIMGPRTARRSRGVQNLTILKLVPEGTLVEKGDFVAELDKSSVQDQINSLELTLEQYENNIEQVRLDCTMTLANARNELINLEFTTEEKLLYMEQSRFEAPAVVRQAEIDYEKAVRALNQAKDNYITRVQQSEARMKEAENNLLRRSRDMQQYYDLMSQFTILAPDNGMVIYHRERNGSKRSEGSSLSPWDPVIATLPDLSVMESVTFVSEVDIQKVQAGLTVEIGIDAAPDKHLTGKVTQVANIGEQRSNSDSKVFEVVILIDGTDYDLRPAMTTSNTLIVAEADDALYIPLEAIHSADTLTYVYNKGGRGKVKQEVLLGLINENAAVIKMGLVLTDEIYLTVPENADELAFSYLQ